MMRMYRGQFVRPTTNEEKSEYNHLMRLAFPERYREIWKKARIKNRENRLAKAREYYRSHPEKRYVWRKNNPEKVKAITKRHREKNKIRRRDYHRRYCYDRTHSDDGYKILCRLRSSLSENLVGRVKSKRTLELLGCSMDDFKLYLESKFETGMTWENYGRNGWHIDHIIPCAIFDLTKPEHQKRCFHFSNMQPLWWRDNIIKGHKPATNQFNLL